MRRKQAWEEQGPTQRFKTKGYRRKGHAQKAGMESVPAPTDSGRIPWGFQEDSGHIRRIQDVGQLQTCGKT